MEISLKDKYYDSLYGDTIRVFKFLNWANHRIDIELKGYDSKYNLVLYGQNFQHMHKINEYYLDKDQYLLQKKMREKFYGQK